MEIICKIQKVDFFIDQYEEIGLLDLEQAIKVFQEFPFTEQLHQSRYRKISSCIPTILFEREDNVLLKISAVNSEGFSVEYNNRKSSSSIYISNNFELNSDGISAEDIIELFFSGQIESILHLNDNSSEDEIEKQDNQYEKDITFSFQIGKTNKYLGWSLGYLTLALFLFTIDIRTDFSLGWGFHAFFSLSWLPGILLHISYWFVNKDAVVTINPKTKKLSYRNGKTKIEFFRTDVHICQINQTRSYKAPWNKYKYIYFKLKNKRKIVITIFLTDPENIINILKPNYQIENRFIPFLPL